MSAHLYFVRKDHISSTHHVYLLSKTQLVLGRQVEDSRRENVYAAVVWENCETPRPNPQVSMALFVFVSLRLNQTLLAQIPLALA